MLTFATCEESCPALCRASTPLAPRTLKHADGEDKPGHDGVAACRTSPSVPDGNR